MKDVGISFVAELNSLPGTLPEVTVAQTPDTPAEEPSPDDEAPTSQTPADGSKVDVLDTSTKQETAEPKKRIYTYNELRQREVEELPALFADKEGHCIILKKGLGVVYGPADCGKSMFLRQMCANVAAGKSYIGWTYKGTHNKAIYFSSEDDADITTPVIKINDKSLNLSEEEGNNLRFVFDYTAEELPSMIVEMLTEECADLVIVDAFGDAFDGRNTNDTTEIRAFYKKFAPIVEEFGCCIIFNHHASKYSASAIPGKSTALGSEAIISRPRFAMELRPDCNDSSLVHLCITKGNYISRELKRSSTVISMDNNLVFQATGEHVLFDDIAANKDTVTSTTRSGSKGNPHSYSDNIHIDIIRRIYGSENVRNKTYIKNKVMEEFGISDVPARHFLQYYDTKGWIKIGTSKTNAGIPCTRLVV